MGTVYDAPRITLTGQDIKKLAEGKEVDFGNVIITMSKDEQPKISDETADMVKYILKTTIEEAMNVENKEDRMDLLPIILGGVDLFDLKR